MTNQIQITHIPLEEIRPSPLNPRKHFDEEAIKELAASIEVQGVLQPILVREIPGRLPVVYEIIAGERRYRASKLVEGITTIPCIIRTMTDEEAIDIQIIENLQRENISPMEEAVGFRQLATYKHLDVREVAARVGKSPHYVAQRMKLNDLIEPIQQMVHSGHVLIKDAMQLCKLPGDDQFEIYSEDMEEGRAYQLTDWRIRKYMHKLSRAPFDLSDDTLRPDMGACTGCQFNSAVNTLLFPEMAADPVCRNRDCFNDKCNISFSREIAKAQEDPAVVLITGQYYPDSETELLMKSIDGILPHACYDIENLEPPDREDYEGNNDTEEEDEQEYQLAMAEYQQEIAEFEEKVAQGKYIKAFVVGGNDKGTYTWVRLNKSKASKALAKTNTNNTEQSSIKDEIQRLKDREERAKELDAQKLWDEIKSHFDAKKNLELFESCPELTDVEKQALAHALHDKLSYPDRDGFYDLFAIEDVNTNHSFSTDQMPNMLRFFFIATLGSRVWYGSVNEDCDAMRAVADEWWPATTETIGIEHQTRISKRIAKVEKRIADLQAKAQELKKEAQKQKRAEKKAAAAPATPAKPKSSTRKKSSNEAIAQ